MSQSNFCSPSFSEAVHHSHSLREAAHLILDSYLRLMHTPASPSSKSQTRVSPEFICLITDVHISGVSSHPWEEPIPLHSCPRRPAHAMPTSAHHPASHSLKATSQTSETCLPKHSFHWKINLCTWMKPPWSDHKFGNELYYCAPKQAHSFACSPLPKKLSWVWKFLSWYLR